MQRVAVLGCGGAGKTTLARALGDRLGLPVVHGDLHRAEWELVQPTVLSRDRWVIDAMRLGSLDERLAAADTAIFIDRGALACLLGVVRRRLRYRGGVHSEEGVADFINWEFVRWIVSFRRQQRRRVLALLARHEPSTRVVVLRRGREIDTFVRSVGSRRARLCGSRGYRGAAMPRSWSELLGEQPGESESEAERQGFFSRLRDSLGKSRRALTEEIALAAFDPADEEAWERLEEALIRADVGVTATAELVQRLEARGTTGDLGTALVGELTELLGDSARLAVADKPSVILVVGVNGTGKTTTIGKLAMRLREHGRSVVVGAADTFRAAAEEQLEIWADRAGAAFVGGERGGDPAAVAYDAIERAQHDGADIVIIDTAGRLHTQHNLMEELAKVRRVIERKLPGAPHETLLVVDATTGQNGLQQARLFGQAVGVTGVALTKLDGSAKGGIAVAIAHELGLPVKLIGIGERLEDLRPFDPNDFARALVSD